MAISLWPFAYIANEILQSTSTNCFVSSESPLHRKDKSEWIIRQVLLNQLYVVVVDHAGSLLISRSHVLIKLLLLNLDIGVGKLSMQIGTEVGEYGCHPATSLKDISVGQQNCKVFGRLIRLWDAINMRSKSADPLISIDGILLDEHGSIAQITVPKRFAKQFRPLLNKGSVYLISNTVAIDAKRKTYIYQCHNYILQFKHDTRIQPLESRGLTIPKFLFDFCSFDEVLGENISSKPLIDLIGVISHIGPYDFASPTSDKKLRRIKIQNLEYGQYGESFNEDATLHKSKDGIVVAIFAGLTAGKFSAITEASSNSATEIYIDLDTPQVREFRTSYQWERPTLEQQLPKVICLTPIQAAGKMYKLPVTITDELGSLDAVAFSFVAEDLLELDAAQASQNMKKDPADHPTTLNNAIGKTKIFAIGMNTDTSSKFPISYVLKKSFTIEPTMSIPMLTDGEPLKNKEVLQLPPPAPHTDNPSKKLQHTEGKADFPEDSIEGTKGNARVNLRIFPLLESPGPHLHFEPNPEASGEREWGFLHRYHFRPAAVDAEAGWPPPVTGHVRLYIYTPRRPPSAANLSRAGRRVFLLLLLHCCSPSPFLLQVKVEDDVEGSGINASVGDLGDAAVNPQPALLRATVKEEVEGQPSSSSSHVRSQFIGMGFSPMLVDRVLQKHGDRDSDTILEALLSQSALQKSGSESGSLGDLFDSDNEENSSHFAPRKEVIQDIKVEADSSSEKRSYLLSTMNFSQREVDLALNQLGEEASLEQLVDFIVTGQVSGCSGGNENGDASNEVKDESLFGVMDKTLHLLQMGFTEEEVSSVIDKAGPEATVLELADTIFARRIASSIEQKEVKVEPDFLDETETSYSAYHPSNSGLRYYDDDHDNIRIKRAKHMFIDDSAGSSSRAGNQPNLDPWLKDHRATTSDGSVKEEFDAMTPGIRRNVRSDVTNPPYFLYGNVVEIPKATWRQLSEFLYNVEPEFVNSQFFSALSRKEGYIHNLPTEGRRNLVPRSPMTIEEAFPFTRQCWPSWDTRKQLNSVATEVAGIEQLCERLGKMVRDSGGYLSQEKKTHIMHQCKLANLIWVGPDRLSPLDPQQVERILGYPRKHTNLFGLNPQDRIEAMRYSFQTDTLGYLLSVLKDLYPDGLRVLSIYSGIGGAAIALHRLGIPLQCVVSVDQSDTNRKILRRWWSNTEQKGQLRQINTIWKLKINVLEDLVKEFGGFDIIIGGNFSSCKGGTTVNSTMGMDSNQFFEYVRVVQRVKHIMGRLQNRG
uniref:SAM-dependent MTase DRM-type domain-containing protein n=1 Tax=Oryza barthii TaxID=65489 RepID=A0A0D3G2X2_9ORYZ